MQLWLIRRPFHIPFRWHGDVAPQTTTRWHSSCWWIGNVRCNVQTRYLTLTFNLYKHTIMLIAYQCCSRVTMPRVRVQAWVSSVRVRVKSKSLKRNPSRVHYSYESSPSRVPIDPHRVRVESESALKHTCCYTVVPQLIGVLMAAAMNFHMYFTVFNSSAHNYCPVLFIITQKCNSNVLYLHIHNHVLWIAYAIHDRRHGYEPRRVHGPPP